MKEVSRSMGDPIEDKFQDFPFEIGHRIQQGVMPIFMICNNDYHFIGTGFTITSTGLMMTAGHVIDEIIKINERYPQLPLGNNKHINLNHPSKGVYALYLDAKEGFMFLPISHCVMSHFFDVGFCILPIFERKDGLAPYPFGKITFATPDIGEHIIGIGYSKMKMSKINVIEQSVHFNYYQDAALTPGIVEEIHCPYRDKVILKFPCFRTNARFESGMSGGPVFNEKGFICGVICSSLSETDCEQGYVSYVSLLLPTVGLELPVANDDGNISNMFFYEILHKFPELAATVGALDRVSFSVDNPLKIAYRTD